MFEGWIFIAFMLAVIIVEFTKISNRYLLPFGIEKSVFSENGACLF